MIQKQQHDEDLQDPRWHAFRGRIMHERGGHCERCTDSKHKQLNVHHKVYVKGRHLWEYDDDKVELLCRKCHKAEHGIKSKNLSLIRKDCTIAQQYARWRVLDLITLLTIQKESAKWKENAHRVTKMWIEAKNEVVAYRFWATMFRSRRMSGGKIS